MLKWVKSGEQVISDKHLASLLEGQVKNDERAVSNV